MSLLTSTSTTSTSTTTSTTSTGDAWSSWRDLSDRLVVELAIDAAAARIASTYGR